MQLALHPLRVTALLALGLATAGVARTADEIEVPIEFRLPAGRSYTALDCWACCVAIQFSRNRTGEL